MRAWWPEEVNDGPTCSPSSPRIRGTDVKTLLWVIDPPEIERDAGIAKGSNDMSKILQVDGVNAQMLMQTRMSEQRFTEPAHLENWIIQHPSVLDAGIKVIANQFSGWESQESKTRDRPDLLALADTGELVVIELKRGSDRNIHLQALTYGALSSAFTREQLAEAHATWLSARGDESVSIESAMELLSSHVDGDWSDELLAVPRLVLVAEDFPGQVVTTVQWLATVAPNLVIECHEYHLFKGEDGSTNVSFQRLFPVDDLSDRLLRPASVKVENASRAVAENKRGARSVSIITEFELIPEGGLMTLELESRVVSETASIVESWLAEDPIRERVRWTSHHSRPLIWEAFEEEGVQWSPTKLRNEIFRRAGAPVPTFSAADA